MEISRAKTDCRHNHIKYTSNIQFYRFSLSFYFLYMRTHRVQSKINKGFYCVYTETRTQIVEPKKKSFDLQNETSLHKSLCKYSLSEHTIMAIV